MRPDDGADNPPAMSATAAEASRTDGGIALSTSRKPLSAAVVFSTAGRSTLPNLAHQNKKPLDAAFEQGQLAGKVVIVALHKSPPTHPATGRARGVVQQWLVDPCK